MSGGWSSAQSRLRHLGKKAEVVVKGKLVSVVYFDEDGVINWPEHPGPGILLTPRVLSVEEWVEKYG